MRKILFLALVLIASNAQAQVQGEAMSAGSNLTGMACRVNESQTALAAESDANFCAVDTKGNQLVSLQSGTASATNPIVLEDTAAVNGQAGTVPLYYINTNGVNLSATEGDLTFGAVNNFGAHFVDVKRVHQVSDSGSLLKGEDLAATSGDAGVASLSKIQAAISADAADGDYGLAKLDTGGRLITTTAPAGETWQACTGAITDTTQTAIKAAVASNRIYVTSFGCNNTAAVASTLVFQDGATAIWQGAISNSTLQGVASYSMTFPTPLRGTSNTALNVTLGTTATNTRCCAAGYISTI